MNRPEYKVCGSRELALFEGAALGAVFPNFEYNSEKGSHAAQLVDEDARDFVSYYNGGCFFEYKEGDSNFATLARYKEANMLPAIVCGFFGKGKVLLSGAHIEYAEEDAVLKDRLTATVRAGMRDGGSIHLLTRCLQKVFDMPMNCTQIPVLSTEWYCFDIGSDTLNTDIDKCIALDIPEASVTLIKSLVQLCKPKGFNVELFAQVRSSVHSNKMLGNCILYAETVTSTQDTLMKSDKLRPILRHGTIFVATNQTKGRGRGSNKWVSAAGCLQFTMVFDLQDESISLPLFQYLVSIAIIQAVCTDNTTDAVDLRIKWPNDIYCKGVKVGGILINSESMDKKVRLYIGVGTNIDHVPFAGSINQLIGESATHPRVLREEFLAKFCIRLEKLWSDWRCTGNFPFDMYYKLWMHSNQKVWIEPEQAEYTIGGIDNDGFLVASRGDISTKLHPSMSSLDPLHGLITRKQ